MTWLKGDFVYRSFNHYLVFHKHFNLLKCNHLTGGVSIHPAPPNTQR